MALTVKELMEAIIQSVRDVNLDSEVLVEYPAPGLGRVVAVKVARGPIGLIDGTLTLVVE